MENNSKGLSKSMALVIFSAAFYTAWALFELIGKPFIDSLVTNEILAQIIKSGIVKNLVWTLPAVLLVKHYSEEVHINLKEMFTGKVNWLKNLPVFAAFVIYILGSKYLAAGELKISSEFGAKEIITYTFVGLTEEMVFRGWLLNATIDGSRKRQWLGIALNAVMFMLIHFPIWISQGIFVSVFTSFSFVSILLLSVIFSLTFIKNRSILVPIALHMMWDILLDLFV